MSQKRYLQIANFDETQMYKDRNPIWIKLHCAILDDYEFAHIPDETKFHAVGLMILAARLNNKLPDDELWLRRKINASSVLNLKILLEIGFLEPVKGARSDVTKSKSDVTEINSAKKAAKKDVTKPLNARNSKKTKGEFVKQLENENSLASHRTEQNRAEEKRTQHNTTDADAENGADAKSRNDVVVVCDFGNSKTEAEEKTDAVLRFLAVENSAPSCALHAPRRQSCSSCDSRAMRPLKPGGFGGGRSLSSLRSLVSPSSPTRGESCASLTGFWRGRRKR